LSWLEVTLQNEKHVTVVKASLLEFDYHHIGCDFSEDVLLEEVITESGELEIEDSTGEIRSHAGDLAREEVLLDLLPLRIARHGEENVGLSMAGDDGHRILIALLHASRTSRKRRCQNDSTAWWSLDVFTGQVVLKALVRVRPQLALVLSLEVEPILLELHVRIDGELLA